MAKGIYIGASGGYKTELVQGDIIPKTWTTVTTGTSYKASDGTKVTASGYVPDGNIGALSADRAFDGDATTPWFSGNDDVSALKWIKLELPSATKITKMKTCVTFSSVYGKNCKIQGSKDDSTWVDLFAITSPQADDTLTEVSLNNTDYYKYYRICGEINRTGLSLCVDEWQVSEYEGTAYDSSIPNKAHKVKKAYIGVENKARKIKKGYIGVGGVARLFYSAEKKLAYYGYIGNKFTTATNLVGGSVGNYAMFNEGQANKQTVAYNSSLVATAPDDLHNRRYDMTAITVGLSKEYLLFCGGTVPVSHMPTSAVDVYDSNLTKGTNLALSQINASQAGGSINGYGVVAGGDWGNTSARGAMVEFFSSALVRSLASDLSEQRSLLASVVIKGEYILFGGGSKVDGSYSSKVDIYDKNLVKKTGMALSTGKSKLLGAATESSGLFAGGYNGTYLTTVDTFNSQLVRGTATNLSHAHYNGGCLSLRGYALFVSGNTSSSSSADKRVSSYDNNLLKQELSIGEARKQCFGATVENFGIVVGGGSITAEAFEVLE